MGWTDGYKTYDTSKGFGNSAKWQNAFEERMNFKVLTAKEEDDHKSIVQPLYNATSKEALRSAYLKLITVYHPDKAGDTEENKTISQLINDTYFKLKKKF